MNTEETKLLEAIDAIISSASMTPKREAMRTNRDGEVSLITLSPTLIRNLNVARDEWLAAPGPAYVDQAKDHDNG